MISITSFLLLAFLIMTFSQRNLLANGHYAIKSGLLQAFLAKETCSCIHVMNYGGSEMEILKKKDLCFERHLLPISPKLLSLLSSSKVSQDGNSILFDVSWLGGLLSGTKTSPAIATYKGAGQGCGLLSPDAVKDSTLYRNQ